MAAPPAEKAEGGRGRDRAGRRQRPRRQGPAAAPGAARWPRRPRPYGRAGRQWRREAAPAGARPPGGRTGPGTGAAAAAGDAVAQLKARRAPLLARGAAPPPGHGCSRRQRPDAFLHPGHPQQEGGARPPRGGAAAAPGGCRRLAAVRRRRGPAAPSSRRPHPGPADAGGLGFGLGAQRRPRGRAALRGGGRRWQRPPRGSHGRGAAGGGGAAPGDGGAGRRRPQRQRDVGRRLRSQPPGRGGRSGQVREFDAGGGGGGSAEAAEEALPRSLFPRAGLRAGAALQPPALLVGAREGRPGRLTKAHRDAGEDLVSEPALQDQAAADGRRPPGSRPRRQEGGRQGAGARRPETVPPRRGAAAALAALPPAVLLLSLLLPARVGSVHLCCSRRHTMRGTHTYPAAPDPHPVHTGSQETHLPSATPPSINPSIQLLKSRSPAAALSASDSIYYYFIVIFIINIFGWFLTLSSFNIGLLGQSQLDPHPIPTPPAEDSHDSARLVHGIHVVSVFGVDFLFVCFISLRIGRDSICVKREKERKKEEENKYDLQNQMQLKRGDQGLHSWIVRKIIFVV